MHKAIECKSYQKCPNCNGRGTIKSVSTIAIELMRRLEKTLAETRAREVFVSLHPDVASHASGQAQNMIRPLERRFRKTIRIIDDPNLHIEDIRIEEVKA